MNKFTTIFVPPWSNNGTLITVVAVVRNSKDFIATEPSRGMNTKEQTGKLVIGRSVGNINAKSRDNKFKYRAICRLNDRLTYLYDEYMRIRPHDVRPESDEYYVRLLIKIKFLPLH